MQTSLRLFFTNLSVKNPCKPNRFLSFRNLLSKRMCMTHAGSTSSKLASRQVLPAHVKPKHYRVFLSPDLPAYKYSGSVEIDLDVIESTNSVSVNILNLVIGNVELREESLGTQKPVSAHHDEDSQSITWTFEQKLPAGSSAVIRVEFDGTLNDEMAGFYRSEHTDANGKKHIVGATQMESTDCRRAFPCFDEPALKSTFDISIAADPKLVVLSNSDVKSTETLGDKLVTHFNTTPLMSSYLVAFIVGELKYVESNAFRVPVRVYATPGMEDRCHYAAELAAKTLEFFESSFGIKYPMPKCDMVGLHEFSSGAMENWGLITYRLVDLFYVEGKQSAKTKMRVTEVIQHELAHQWFGNLVTMEWWDGLWLNEGFATWMSWYAANHFYPDWKVWETYVHDAYSPFLELDGLRNSHPVQVPIARADQVPEIFDAISYMKGSCIIRMVSQWLGEPTFIKGISHYLSVHQYGNTTTDDLWAALSESSGEDVKAFLDTWVKETGYPLVTANEYDSETSQFEISQRRFLASGDVKPEDDKVIYPIWLNIRKSDGTVDRESMLLDRSKTFSIENAGEFYKLNANHNGLYRVKYPDSALSKIIAEGSKGNDSLLTPEDKMGIILDLRAMSGHEISTVKLLEVAEQWSSEEEPNVVYTLMESLQSIHSHLFYQSEETRTLFRDFCIKVLSPFAMKHGFKFAANDLISLSTAKSELFAFLVSLDAPEFVNVALDLFSKEKFDVDPNLALGVFKAVARHGKPEQWDELFAHYKEGTNGASGHDALESLGSSNDPERTEQILRSIFDRGIMDQDVYRAIRGLVKAHPMAHTKTLDWLIGNWDSFREQFPGFGGTCKYVIKDTFNHCTTQSQLDLIKNTIDHKNLNGIERSVAQGIDTLMSWKGRWENDGDALLAWLRQRKAN